MILRVFPWEDSECYQKILREPSDSSCGNTLSIQGTTHGEHFHCTTLGLDSHFAQWAKMEHFDTVWQYKNAPP